MSGTGVKFSVFTKPWKEMPLERLGEYVKSLGFDGVDLPVREGFQVEPANAERELPAAAKILEEQGISILSVADGTEEKTISACAAGGVPMIRICVRIEGGFMESIEAWKRKLDDLVPILDKHGVTLGLQNHCGPNVANAMGLRYLLEDRDPRHVAAVWDAAHNALEGERPEYAIDILWPHIRMVNLKNAYWLRTNGPEAEVAEWKTYWTSGRHGLASWPRVAAELNCRGYEGVICLTAEYSDNDSVDRLIAEDIAFAKALFEQSA